MPPREKSRFWRTCRVGLRRCRITLLLLLLAFLGSLLYLNQIGLPGFIKKPLLTKLRARGVDLEFSRLRWRWHRGVVAERVQFGRSQGPLSPTLSADEVEVRLNYPALARFHVQVDAITLSDGQLSWPVGATNQPGRELSARDIHTELRFLPGDLWALNRLQARFAGADLRLSGFVTNASAIRQWPVFHAREPAPPDALHNRLQALADTLGQMRFSTPPQLNLDVQGDARDPQSFTVRLQVNAPDAETPWGTVRQGALSALLLPAASNTLAAAEIHLQAASARTRWVDATDPVLTLHLFSPQPGSNSVEAHLHVKAGGIDTRWGRAAGAQFTADWLHSLTNAIPLSGRGDLQLIDASTPWGAARELQWTGTLAGASQLMEGDASWGWWTNLAPYSLGWDCAISGLTAPKLQADRFACAGLWTAPVLTLSNITAALYDGSLQASANVDVATRQFAFAGSSDFEVHRIAPLLTEKSRIWLAQYSWTKPPALRAGGSMVLPAWTNLPHADWRGQVRPTIRLDGSFGVGNGAFRGIPFTSARSHFSYSNMVWRLPDLAAARPEGTLDLFLQSDEQTRDYHFRVRSAMDVRAVRVLFDPDQQRHFDLLTFTNPPVVNAEIRGRWYEPERVAARGHVRLDHFTFRGQSATLLETAFDYTNQVLTLSEPRIERGPEETMTASLVSADFAARKIRVTDGLGKADPIAVARAIGPRISRHIEPYVFSRPPTVRVEGIIPIGDVRLADLHFDVSGGPFAWWKFNVPRISGRVDWVGQHLALQEVRAQFYEGTAAGSAQFDFQRDQGADFSFHVAATEADVHLLMSDLVAGTNHLEGFLTARLAVTHANSGDLQSVQGNGEVSLRDGLIWEIPVFGILSPVLDSLAPGMGNARVSEGSATFSISNGVVRSDDLELRAAVMRLQYGGAVDLQGNVNARVEVEILRDMWVVGRIVSVALWPVTKLFEYKITGTLHEPESEPLYFVPKIIQIPFHPFRSMRELIQESAPPAPPTGPPPPQPPGAQP